MSPTRPLISVLWCSRILFYSCLTHTSLLEPPLSSLPLMNVGMIFHASERPCYGCSRMTHHPFSSPALFHMRAVVPFMLLPRLVCDDLILRYAIAVLCGITLGGCFQTNTTSIGYRCRGSTLEKSVRSSTVDFDALRWHYDDKIGGVKRPAKVASERVYAWPLTSSVRIVFQRTTNRACQISAKEEQGIENALFAASTAGAN